MKLMANNKLTLSGFLLFITIFLLSGCSTNARQFAWSAYENRDAAIDERPMLTPRTQRSLLLATYASHTYLRSNQIAYDAELVSRDTPVLLAWIEFSETDKPLPLYRYVIQPLKAITAEELLSQGKYIINRTAGIRRLPALTPTKTTDGAVVTDWQYCYSCYMSTPLEELTSADIIRLHDTMKKTFERKPIRQMLFINNFDKESYRNPITIYSGKEAQQQQAKLARRVTELEHAIAKTKHYDQKYSQFIDEELKPLTFEFWAEQAGCPKNIANPREIHGNRRSQSNKIIQINMDYIDCNSKVLESYDLSSYQASYENLVLQEQLLWEQSSKLERYRIIPPERTINSILQSIDLAVKGNESAYSDLELADRLDARNRQLDAFSQQIWAKTFNNIKQRNNDIKARYQQTQQMIQNIKNTPATQSQPKTNNSVIVKNKPSSLSPKQSIKPTNTVQATTVQTNTKDTSLSSLNSQAETSTTEKNSYVGSGRDYPFTGKSGQFYKRELAEELAELNLMNQAAAFCGGGRKAEIRWSDHPICKASSSEKGNFNCSIDATVNCYQKLCDEAFCGTKP